MAFLIRIKQMLGLAAEVIEDETDLVDNDNSPIFGTDLNLMTPIAAPDNAASLRRENERLREENRSMKMELDQARLSNSRQRQALLNRINDLQNQVLTLEEEKEALLVSQISRHADAGQAADSIPADDDPVYSHDKEALRQARLEIMRLTTLNEQLDAKSRMSDKMMSDLNARANNARREVDRLNEELRAVDALKGQMEQIEEIIRRKDQQIARLQEQAESAGSHDSELEELRRRTERLNGEREQLRRTIETNLYNQAHSESRLRQRIKELEKRLEQLSSPEDETPQPKRPRRQRRPKDDAAGTDAPSSQDNPGDAGAFGYQPPRRNAGPDDPAQLTLF